MGVAIGIGVRVAAVHSRGPALTPGLHWSGLNLDGHIGALDIYLGDVSA